MNLDLYEQAPFRNAARAEFRPGSLGLTEELAVGCGLVPGQHVLDLGCGVGSTASFLARQWGVCVVGLDSSSRFIGEARMRDPSGTWVVGRAEETPFPAAYFDVVFCECFLSAVDDPAKVLREIRRVLRTGGRLAVSDMYLRNPGCGQSLRGIPSATCLGGAASRETAVSMLEQAGFTVLVWRDRSDALKAFMARMVFAYGSAADFWEAVLGAGWRGTEAIALARPGYHLLVAESRSGITRA